MSSTWDDVLWGDVSELRYGKALTGYRGSYGTVEVFGTNGPIGWTERDPLGIGPRPVVGRKGAYRGVHLARGPFWVIDTAYWLEPTPKLDPVWAYYKLVTVDINGMDSGSAIPSLTRDHFAALPLRLPPIEEQRRIAEILGAFDDLVRVNERIRLSIDRSGVALVKELVQRHGCDLVTLGDAASVIETGRRPRGGVRGINDGVPSIGAESIDGLGVFDFTKTKYVPADFAASMRAGVLTNRDVLVYKDGGKPGDFRPHVGMYGEGFPFARMTINEHVYRIRAADSFTEPYLYFWLSTAEALAAMRRLGTGAAIPGLNSTALKSVPVALPPENVRRDLYPALDALVAEALAAASEARRLALCRDELLPLLLSGRVRVEDVAA